MTVGRKLLDRLLTVIFVTIIIVLGVATFVEQAQGSAFSSSHIYGTWWFVALWALLTLVSCVVIGRHRLWKRLPVFLLHVSFIVILAGAAITFLTSHEGVLHLRKGEPTGSFVLKDSGAKASLPVADMTLREFNIIYYPGTQAPQDFESHVTFRDSDGKTRQEVISMNKILREQGYRFYQTSFDPDMKGSILTVNYDPWGTPVTYCGYLLLALSFLVVLFSKAETFRKMLRSPLLGKGAILLLLLSAFQPQPAQARSVPTINSEKAERLARMPVMYNNRVAPLSTLALDFTTKIYGKGSYKGLSAEQVLYGWMKRPEVWKDEPMIKIKDKELRRKLGVEGKYARFSDLFDANGQYKLYGMSGVGQDDKAVRELDEKVGIILMLVNGTLVQPASGQEVSPTRLEAEVIYNKVPLPKVLAMGNLTLGILTFILLLFPSFRYRRTLMTGSKWLLRLSCLLLAVYYCLRWYIGGRVPLSNGYETMIFMSLCTMIVALVVSRRFTMLLPFGFLLSGFCLLVSFLGQMNPQITPLMPVLQSPLLSIHVSVIMMAYALLAFIMLCGVTALIQYHRHDKVQVDTLTLLSRLMLYPAVFLLAIGIFIGAVWANVSWGKYWSWDPKEVWALITLMIYAVPLHRTTLWSNDSSIRYHLYVVIAFLSVLMTYFGVNWFLGGMHSYA